eukprot:8776690-Pyramimonas_sp.AAC.1
MPETPSTEQNFWTSHLPPAHSAKARVCFPLLTLIPIPFRHRSLPAPLLTILITLHRPLPSLRRSPTAEPLPKPCATTMGANADQLRAATA